MKMKKLLSLSLAFLFILSAIPFSTFTVSATELVKDYGSYTIKYIIGDNTAKVDGGGFKDDKTGVLTIPSTVDGRTVTTIDHYAFSMNKTITGVVIPSTVTSIGWYAFSSSGIKSVTFSEGLEVIQNSAFRYTAITSVKFPDSLKTIDTYAFGGCLLSSIDFGNAQVSILEGAFGSNSPLREIVLPDTLVSRADGAFSNCVNVKSVTAPFLGNSATVTGGTLFSFFSSKSSGTCPPIETVTLTSSCKYIGNNAFSSFGSTLKKVNILSDDILSIGESAFYCCKFLEEIDLPDNLTSIGYYAFQSCNSLKSIEIPDSVQTIGTQAFYGCQSLTSVVIPKNLTTLNSLAFSSCIELESITLPENLTSIGENCFSLCKKLETIHIPAKVTSIGTGAFSSCTNLKSITVDSANTTFKSINNCLIKNKKIIQGLADSVIPDDGSVTSIGENAFSRSGIKEVHIPACVTSIDRTAFRSCPSVTSFTVDEKNRYYIAKNNCLIEKSNEWIINGFPCSTIPDDGSVDYIFHYAFYGSLTEETKLTIPAAIQNIGMYAFAYCHGITEVEFLGDNDYLSIAEYSFYDCSNIKKVTLPKKISYIGPYAFYNCKALETISEVNASSIKRYAFAYCDSLKTLRIGSNLSTLETNFAGYKDIFNQNLTIYLINNSLNQKALSVVKNNTSNYVVIGDLNGDEFSDATDLAQFKKVLLKKSTANNTDINGDGNLNILDLIYFKKSMTEEVIDDDNFAGVLPDDDF